eukprot:g2990.t1
MVHPFRERIAPRTSRCKEEVEAEVAEVAEAVPALPRVTKVAKVVGKVVATDQGQLRNIMSAERRRQLFDSPDDRSPSPPRRQRFASRGSSRGSRSPARRPAPGFSNAEPGNATGFGNGDFRGASDGAESQEVAPWSCAEVVSSH